VALFLEESGLPYDPIPVDTRKGEQHNPEYLAINPNAKVPAIVDAPTTWPKTTCEWVAFPSVPLSRIVCNHLHSIARATPSLAAALPALTGRDRGQTPSFRQRPADTIARFRSFDSAEPRSQGCRRIPSSAQRK
jgi:hypothetical protein